MRKILVVDDELTILEGLSKALGGLCNFHEDVRTVVNGREAIYETECCFYDICFLDITLPDIDGRTVQKDINAISPETNIVFMSARFASDELKKIAEDNGAFYIEKPFDLYKISHVIKLALEGDKEYDIVKRYCSKENMIGNRSFRRRPLMKTVSCCLTDTDYMEIKCGGVDISYSGIGIQTYYPLEQGQIVFFNKGVARKTGIVAWSNRDGVDNYRAGIKFV